MTDPIIVQTDIPIEATPDLPVSQDPPQDSSPSERPPVSEYERRLREENAEYRKKWGKYEELFDGFEDPEQREAVETLVELAKSGDDAARGQVAEIFGLSVPEPEAPNYMTRDDFEREWSERMSKVEQDNAINDVYKQAESLGYERDTEDMVRLLWHLNQMDEPNIKAADEAVKGQKQQIIDEYLSSKKKTADSTPRQPTGAAAVPNLGTPAKTFKEARDRAAARYSQQV